MIIRSMRSSDLDFAAECTAREDWVGETRKEFEGFLAYHPQGCFVAETNGQPVGVCIATPYGEFGFVGELIVVETMRGRGMGRSLLERAVHYLHERGAQTVFLDGVLAALSLYERAGFRRVCRSLRYHGHASGQSHPHVRPMHAADLAAAAELDRRAFGADRHFFLARRLALYPELCYVLEREGDVAAFVMGRRGRDWVSAGPWVVGPGVDHPGQLLESLALRAGDVQLSLGVLAANTQAVATLRALGLAEHPESPWRMALGPVSLYGDPTLCYAIGSAAKG